MSYKKIEIKPSPIITNQMFKKLFEGEKNSKMTKR